MADLTQGAVDSLLNLLSSAIKDEARLLRGVQGDIQFIKDEMDSMNGFLLHLTKTETAHNDQHRAWMKQVRDISYVSQDCIELYLRDLSPPTGTGVCARIRHLPMLLRTWPTRRGLANQLHELKDRVREVGERRLRYGVSVPESAVPKPEPAGRDGDAVEKREEFLHALQLEHEAASPSPSFSKAISLLPGGLPSDSEVNEMLRVNEGSKKHVESMKILLRALYAYPNVTKEELANLKKKLEGNRAVDVTKEVMMTFSYSKLSTHYKSCLQYLTTFLEEACISRTSLVRRWIAEGLVAWDDQFQMEELGERCFDELVFLGFIHPEPPVVPGLRIKRCRMEKLVRDFVIGMAKSENFVPDLPTHLHHQLKIREIARREPRQDEPQQIRPWQSWKNICPRKPQKLLVGGHEDSMAVAEEKRHPMTEMVHLLKTLPKEYRLNVLDLGGCSTLKDDHLKSTICKVLWLKYLSIRKTNVTRLPKAINNLRRLETLDVRQTRIRASDTRRVDLPQLKNLLAGHIIHLENDESSLSLITVQLPGRIGRSMEILRYVQVLDGQAELEAIGHRKKLRKLGVVIQGREEEVKEKIKHLLRAIANLSECLRSLSVWIHVPANNNNAGGGLILGDDDMDSTMTTTIRSSSLPKNLESLNIKYFTGSGSSLPGWIQGLTLLSKITLRDTQLSAGCLQKLGNLENLRCLRLRRGSYTELIIALGKDQFKNLRFLLIDRLTQTIKIAFHAGAAPKLEKITWTFGAKKMEIMEDTISGINNLESLEELELNGDWVDQQDHVNKALAEHPKRPRLSCSFPDSSFDGNRAHNISITETS